MDQELLVNHDPDMWNAICDLRDTPVFGDFDDELLNGQDAYLPNILSDYEESNSMCNIKQSKDTTASISNMDSSDMDSTDVEELSSFRDHDIKADLATDHKDIKKLAINSKSNLLQTNLANTDNVNMRPINLNRNEMSKNQRNPVLADISVSHNIQLSPAKSSNEVLISEDLICANRSSYRNESLKATKPNAATKIKKRKLKTNNHNSALKPVYKKSKDNLFKLDTGNQGMAAVNYLSTGKENWAPKNDQNTNNKYEIKKVKKRNVNVTQTTDESYTKNNSRVDTSQIFNSKDNQDKRHRHRSSRKGVNSNIDHSSDNKKNLRRERNRVHSRNHRIKKKMQFQTLAEDNHRLQVSHKTMKNQLEKFLIQLRYSADTLLKQVRSGMNLKCHKVIYDSALKLRSEIGMQIESFHKQSDC